MQNLFHLVNKKQPCIFTAFPCLIFGNAYCVNSVKCGLLRKPYVAVWVNQLNEPFFLLFLLYISMRASLVKVWARHEIWFLVLTWAERQLGDLAPVTFSHRKKVVMANHYWKTFPRKLQGVLQAVSDNSTERKKNKISIQQYLYNIEGY